MAKYVSIPSKPRKIPPEWQIDVDEARKGVEEDWKKIEELDRQMRINKQVPRETLQQQLTKNK